jgi:hypothetical protein
VHLVCFIIRSYQVTSTRSRQYLYNSRLIFTGLRQILPTYRSYNTITILVWYFHIIHSIRFSWAITSFQFYSSVSLKCNSFYFRLFSCQSTEYTIYFTLYVVSLLCPTNITFCLWILYIFNIPHCYTFSFHLEWVRYPVAVALLQNTNRLIWWKKTYSQSRRQRKVAVTFLSQQNIRGF